MISRDIKPNKGLAGTAARWFGLLGVIAATVAVVLVPIVMDPNMLSTDATRAYYQPELKALLATSVVLVVATTGMVIFDRRPLGAPLLVPSLTLLGVSALSTLFSDKPVHSLYGDRGEGLLSLIGEVLLFYALARGLNSPARVRLFLTAAATAATLVAVYGIAQNYGFSPISGWGNPPFTDLGRSFATVGNPLTLAAYLTLMMGAATALWLGAASRVRRAAWLVALALIGACWIYAEARGALLGAGVALPVVLLAARRRMGTVRPLVVPSAVLVAAMAVAVAVSGVFGFSTLPVRACAVLLVYLAFVGMAFWLLERGRARLALLLVLVVLLGLGATAFAAVSSGKLTLADLGVTRAEPSVLQYGDLSLQTRLYIWRDTVPMILDRPLLGHGPDNYGKPFRPYMSDEFKALVSDDRGNVPSLDRAHNHLLQLAATVGLLGLAAYLWLLVSYFRNVYRYGGWALAAFAGVVLAYVLQIQTAFPSIATDVAFWGVLGSSAALMRLRDEEGGRVAEEADIPLRSEAFDGDNNETLGIATVVESRRSRRHIRSSGWAELLVAGAVVALLTAIALPVFAEQREKFAKAERVESNIQLRVAVDRYVRFLTNSETVPRAGVYNTTRPVKNLNGRPLIKPPAGVTVTIETTLGGEFMMEWKKTTLAGTFVSSYDSATGSYSASS